MVVQWPTSSIVRFVSDQSLSMLFQVKIGKSTHKWMCVRKNNVNVSYTWYRPLPFGVFKFVFVASSDLGKPVGNLPFTTQKEFVELTSFVLIIQMTNNLVIIRLGFYFQV